MSKFGRRCQLSVEVNPNAQGVTQGNLVIPPQFTVEFEINRQSLTGSQTGTFKIWNLGPKTRNLLYKDTYARTEYRAIQFRAGYEDQPVLPLCFNGFVLDAASYRDGVDTITEIHAFDGGTAQAAAFTAMTVVSGLTVAQVLRKLCIALPNVTGLPYIGAFPSTNLRGKVLMGPTWQIILEESNGLATIDNGQVKILNYNEAIRADIPVLNAASGLLGSPRVSSTNLEVNLLFEPRLTVGQIIQLASVTNPQFNGTYKVMGFTHKGIISPAVSGECESNVKLFFGTGERNSALTASNQFNIVEASAN